MHRSAVSRVSHSLLSFFSLFIMIFRIHTEAPPLSDEITHAYSCLRCGAVYTCIGVQDNNNDNDTRIQEIRFNNPIFTICHPRLSHFPNHQFNTRIFYAYIFELSRCVLPVTINFNFRVMLRAERSRHTAHTARTKCVHCMRPNKKPISRAINLT